MTRVIIALNVAVYVAMGLSGVSWTDPNVLQAIHWGANFGPLTLGGEWWRLLTCMFVHFGFLHIALNMWCLWSLAMALEPMMGRLGFGLTYLFSGLGASAVSTAWNPWRASAGASGAIFGIAGAFVSYLLLKKAAIPASLVRQNLRSLAIFIFLNLSIGAANGHIDNSAHLGGLISGLMIGAFIPRFRSSAIYLGGPSGQMAGAPLGDASAASLRKARLAWIAVACTLALIVGMWQVRAANLPAAQYGRAVSLSTSGRLDDAIVEMRKLVAVDPDNVLAQVLLGDWLLEKNDPSGAVPAFEQALQVEAGTKLIEHNLALAYLGAGRPREALGEITKVATLDNEQLWKKYFIWGVAAEQVGNSELAAQNLRSALQLNANFPEAEQALARLNAKPDEKIAAGPIPYSKLIMKSGSWPYYP